MSKLRLTLRPPRRSQDKWGSGAFGAPRGDHMHQGIDFESPKGFILESPIAGKITKLGHPYADDLSFRYIELTSGDDYKHRFFYLVPSVSLGDSVLEGDVLGAVDFLGFRYPDITNHFHYEIKSPMNSTIDPDEYWK